MGTLYVGIDLGCKTCAGAVRDRRGKLLELSSFPTSAENLIDFVSKQKGEVRVLIEECELAGWVYRTLLPHVKAIEVSDPKHNAWIARGKRKSDPVDAGKLAELLRGGFYRAVHHPEDDEMANFKIVVQHYDQMTKTTTRLQNQIKARFRQQGIMTSGKGVYGSAEREAAIARVESEAIREILRQDFRLLDQAQKDRASARSLVTRLSRDFPVIKRLKAIPGVGVISASRFVAYVQNPHRFNRKALTSFSRLAIVKRESGDSFLGGEHLSKEGNGTMKALSRTVFNAAVINTKKMNGIKTYYLCSLRTTRNETHARLNTQRKILAVMNVVWRDETGYSDDLVTGKGANRPL
ncbi:MAG: IS110 family transposase [Candidatus Eisenbacteria bacterium]